MFELLTYLLERRFLCARNQQSNLQDIDYVLVWLEKWVDIVWHLYFLFVPCVIFFAVGSERRLHINWMKCSHARFLTNSTAIWTAVLLFVRNYWMIIFLIKLTKSNQTAMPHARMFCRLCWCCTRFSVAYIHGKDSVQVMTRQGGGLPRWSIRVNKSTRPQGSDSERMHK